VNAKQKTVIGIALAVIVGMGLYPPWRFCGLQYGWLLSPLEVPEKCFSTTFELATEFELATDRLFLQWGFVSVLAVGLVFAFKGPKALEPLKDYQGATFRFTEYTAPSEHWRYDHCAGCRAKFAEHDGQGILHEAYVSTVHHDEATDESQPFTDGSRLIFVCARCFNQCRGTLDFRVELPSALELG
jgi:hypothetical protein